MLRHTLAFAAAAALLVISCSVARADSAPARDTAPAGPGIQGAAVAPGSLEQAPPQHTYGPIRSKDPLVRAQIKHVYEQMAADQATALDAIRKLNQQLAVTTDPDFRVEIAHQIATAKTGFEHRRIELGLQIAQLDADPIRVAQYSLALDQLDHPEKYLPRFSPDAVTPRPAPPPAQK